MAGRENLAGAGRRGGAELSPNRAPPSTLSRGVFVISQFGSNFTLISFAAGADTRETGRRVWAEIAMVSGSFCFP